MYVYLMYLYTRKKVINRSIAQDIYCLKTCNSQFFFLINNVHNINNSFKSICNDVKLESMNFIFKIK